MASEEDLIIFADERTGPKSHCVLNWLMTAKFLHSTYGIEAAVVVDITQ